MRAGWGPSYRARVFWVRNEATLNQSSKECRLQRRLPRCRAHEIDRFGTELWHEPHGSFLSCADWPIFERETPNAWNPADPPNSGHPPVPRLFADPPELAILPAFLSAFGRARSGHQREAAFRCSSAWTRPPLVPQVHAETPRAVPAVPDDSCYGSPGFNCRFTQTSPLAVHRPNGNGRLLKPDSQAWESGAGSPHSGCLPVTCKSDPKPRAFRVAHGLGGWRNARSLGPPRKLSEFLRIWTAAKRSRWLAESNGGAGLKFWS